MECRCAQRWEFCPSVRLSVCLSVKCVDVTKCQNGRKICPDFYTIRKIISLVFWEEEWLVGATPSTWNFWSTGSRWSKIVNFQPIFARMLHRSLSHRRSMMRRRHVISWQRLRTSCVLSDAVEKTQSLTSPNRNRFACLLIWWWQVGSEIQAVPTEPLDSHWKHFCLDGISVSSAVEV